MMLIGSEITMPQSFFCLVNGTPRNVPIHQMKFTVPAIKKSGLVGAWHDGKLYAPCPKQFRESLPYRWRASFDRAMRGDALGFFFDKYDNEACRISLTDARGKYLATIYCMFKESA